MPLTWKNITSNPAAGVADLMRNSVDFLDSGAADIAQIGSDITARQKRNVETRIGNAERDFRAALGQYGSVEAFEAAKQNGELDTLGNSFDGYLSDAYAQEQIAARTPALRQENLATQQYDDAQYRKANEGNYLTAMEEARTGDKGYLDTINDNGFKDTAAIAGLHSAFATGNADRRSLRIQEQTDSDNTIERTRTKGIEAIRAETLKSLNTRPAENADRFRKYAADNELSVIEKDGKLSFDTTGKSSAEIAELTQQTLLHGVGGRSQTDIKREYIQRLQEANATPQEIQAMVGNLDALATTTSTASAVDQAELDSLRTNFISQNKLGSNRFLKTDGPSVSEFKDNLTTTMKGRGNESLVRALGNGDFRLEMHDMIDKATLEGIPYTNEAGVVENMKLTPDMIADVLTGYNSDWTEWDGDQADLEKLFINYVRKPGIVKEYGDSLKANQFLGQFEANAKARYSPDNLINTAVRSLNAARIQTASEESKAKTAREEKAAEKLSAAKVKAEREFRGRGTIPLY